jgi:hypothetical protein
MELPKKYSIRKTVSSFNNLFQQAKMKWAAAPKIPSTQTNPLIDFSRICGDDIFSIGLKAFYESQ